MIKAHNNEDSANAIKFTNIELFNRDALYSRELKQNSIKKESKQISESQIPTQYIMMKTHPLDTA